MKYAWICSCNSLYSWMFSLWSLRLSSSWWATCREFTSPCCASLSWATLDNSLRNCCSLSAFSSNSVWCCTVDRSFMVFVISLCLSRNFARYSSKDRGSKICCSWWWACIPARSSICFCSFDSSGSWLCLSAWSCKSDPLIIPVVTVFCAYRLCISRHASASALTMFMFSSASPLSMGPTLLRLFQKEEVVLFRQRPRVCLSVFLCFYPCLYQYVCDRSVLRDRWSKSRTGVCLWHSPASSRICCVCRWILWLTRVVPSRSCPEGTMYRCLWRSLQYSFSHCISWESTLRVWSSIASSFSVGQESSKFL